MMSSGQVMMMMNQQNQGFAGNMAFSQQISQGMPGAYGGGQGGFSYGGGMNNNPAISNAIGDRAMSAGAGVANFGMGLAGSAAMGGAFMGAAKMARIGGAGFLGAGAAGMVAAAPIAGAMAIGKHVIGSMMGGAREQARVENVLGNFQMSSTSGTAGGGFDRTGSKAVGDMMRKMEALPEMMTSMGELTRIMDKMGQAGMMQGTQNVAEFQRKFKENIKVLKEMSKVMGSTMEEALPMFGELRRTGFYSAGDIMKNAMSRQITGGVTGMSQGQVSGLAAVGSQMSFQTGGSRKTGAQHALRVANQIGAAKQMGLITSDQIMELTGQEGAAGVQAMSQQLTQTSYRMMRGAPGTMMTLAMGAQEEGKYTGKMDQSLVARMQAGEFSTSDLMKMARKKSRGRGAAMSYVARKQAMKSEMAGSLGVTGQAQMLQNILGERGFNNPDAMRIVSQRFGMSEREADLMVKLGSQMPDIQSAMKDQSLKQAKKLAQDSIMKGQYSFDAVKAKAKKRISNAVTKPFKDFGARLRHDMNEAIDGFVNDVTGKYQVEVTKSLSDLASGAMGDIKGYRAELGSMMGGAVGDRIGKASMMGQDLTTGKAGSLMNWLSGSETGGDRYARALQMTGAGRAGLRTGTEEGVFRGGLSAGGLQRQGAHVLGRERNVFSRNKLTYISGAAEERAREELATLAGGGMTARMQNAGLGEGLTSRLRQDYMRMQTFGDIGDKTGAARIQAQEKYMRGMRGGAYAEAQRRSGMGAAELLTMAGGGQGLQADLDIFSKIPGLTEGGGISLAQSVEKMEKGLAKGAFGGDTEKTQKYLAAMKGLQGPGARKMLGAMLGNVEAVGGRRKQVMLPSSRPGMDMSQELMREEITGDLQKVMMSGGANSKHLARLGGAGGQLGQIATGLGMLTGDEADVFKKGYTKEAMMEFANMQAAKSLDGKELSKGAQVIMNAQQGLLEQQGSRMQLNRLLDKDPADFTDSDKALLRQIGKDPDTFGEADKRELRDLQDAVKGLSPQEQKLLSQHAAASGASGIAEIASRFRKGGQASAAALKTLSSSGAVQSKEGQAMIKRLQGVSGRMKSMKGVKGIMAGFGMGENEEARAWQEANPGKELPIGMRTDNQSIQQQISDIAADMETVTDPMERRAIMMAAEEQGIGGAVAGVSRARKALYRGKRGKRHIRGKGATLEDLGIDEAKAAMMGGEEYAHIKGLMKGGKSAGRADTMEEAHAIEKYLAGAGQKLLTGAGTEQRTKYADPVAIAQSMEAFSNNVNALAEVIKTIKEEKKEGEK